MKKFKVEKKFRDKKSKAIYEVGSLIELSEERGEEVIANLGDDFLSAVVEEENTEEQVNKKLETDVSTDDLKQLEEVTSEKVAVKKSKKK